MRLGQRCNRCRSRIERRYIPCRKWSQKAEKAVGCFVYPDAHYKEYEQSLGNLKMIEDGIALPLHNADSVKSFICQCKTDRELTEMSLF